MTSSGGWSLDDLSPEVRERLEQLAEDLAASRNVSLEVAREILDRALHRQMPSLVEQFNTLMEGRGG